MKKIILAIVLLLATLCTYNSNCQTIGINEFITSNKNIVTDPSGDYDDAIELINLTNDTINLLGYYLSDDTKEIICSSIDVLLSKLGLAKSISIFIWSELFHDFKKSVKSPSSKTLSFSMFDLA